MYELKGLENPTKWNPKLTPYGKPSDSYIIGKNKSPDPHAIPIDLLHMHYAGTLHGVRVAFLARHGQGHRLLPSEVPGRANIHGFKELGVKWLISVSACGSLAEELKPGHFAIPNGLFDRTSRGSTTFFGDGAVAHVSLADPFCGTLCKVSFSPYHHRNLGKNIKCTIKCMLSNAHCPIYSALII